VDIPTTYPFSFPASLPVPYFGIEEQITPPS